MTNLQIALKNLIIAMAIYGKEMNWREKDVIAALDDIGIAEDEIEVCNIELGEYLGR